MALRFFDGFDHYVFSDILQKWSSGNTDVSFVGGRFGGNAYQVQGNRNVNKILDAQSEWIVGFGWFGSGQGDEIFMLQNGATDQVAITWNATLNKIQVQRATTVLGTSTATLAQNVWYHIVWRTVIHDTTGIFQVWIDGVLDINLSSQDTNVSGGTADRIRMGGGGNGNVIGRVDDFYMLDGTGSAPYNASLGDCRIETLRPNGNGNSSQLVGSDANSTDNYLLVDETTPDSDTTYVESSTVGDKDTYTYGNLASASGTVYAVQILPYAKKTDAGSRSIVTVARLSSTEVDSGVITLPSSYAYTQDIRTTKPGGGSWSISDVNSAEFGVKVNA